MTASHDESIHTSIYDQIKGSRGDQMVSVAFDLKVTEAREAGETLRDTPVAKLKEQLAKNKRNLTGRKVAQDAWLAPLTIRQSLAANSKQ